MHKDEFKIGYAERYIVFPQTYSVWDTQTNCWVSETANNDKQIVHECANKFNEWNNKAIKPTTL
jgi:hypothetical protein